MGFSFRTPSDGTVHTETISFLVGDQLDSLHWDMVGASITGANITPAIGTSLQGQFVLIPSIPILNGTTTVPGGTNSDGSVAPSVIVPVALTTAPAGPFAVSGGPTFNPAAAWLYLGQIQTMFDTAAQRLRVTVALNAGNGVELMQLSYFVTMLAGVGTPISRPTKAPIAKKRQRLVSKKSKKHN